MKSVVLVSVLVFVFTASVGQPSLSEESNEAPLLSFVNLEKDGNTLYGNTEQGSSRLKDALLDIIHKADHTASLNQLASVVKFCSEHYRGNAVISAALLPWLRENHPVYTNKSPTEVNQFRGFLLYSMVNFSPSEVLYTYVKNDLQVRSHLFNIAAAAYAAKLFTSKAELVDMLNPFLENSFQDGYVDITTPELQYPLVNATTVQREVIHTLESFGAEAYSSVPLIVNIMEREDQKQDLKDTVLIRLCHQSLASILNSTPACCMKEEAATESQVSIISKKSRKEVMPSSLYFLDQESKAVRLKHLKGKPFIITFFYTSCTNPLKCASTVDRLGKLQQLLMMQKLDRKAGLYGITYDVDFDSPSILKSYGEVYGMHFTKNARFLVPEKRSMQSLFTQLDVRVNYGYGTVNQHGLQLFVIDKHGKIAAVYDNDVWQVEDVYKKLVQLIEE